MGFALARPQSVVKLSLGDTPSLVLMASYCGDVWKVPAMRPMPFVPEDIEPMRRPRPADHLTRAAYAHALAAVTPDSVSSIARRLWKNDEPTLALIERSAV